jgi:DNA-binding NarL/FixJ family response regulator
MKQECVVLADNHQNMLEGIRGLLEAEFDTVVMVADKKSLFETVQRLKPDLAVVDLSLPVCSEVNVARELHGLHPDLRFIILSVHDDARVAREVMASGAAGFVLKRSVGTDLYEAIDQLTDGRTYVSPPVETDEGP